MKKSFLALKFWEISFFISLVVYAVDAVFLFSIFYVTIPLTFFLGLIASVFAVIHKAYLRALICILFTFWPICCFMAIPLSAHL